MCAPKGDDYYGTSAFCIQPTTADVSYAQNQVVDLPQEAIKVLGDSVQRADDRDITVQQRLAFLLTRSDPEEILDLFGLRDQPVRNGLGKSVERHD